MRPAWTWAWPACWTLFLWPRRSQGWPVTSFDGANNDDNGNGDGGWTTSDSNSAIKSFLEDPYYRDPNQHVRNGQHEEENIAGKLEWWQGQRGEEDSQDENHLHALNQHLNLRSKCEQSCLEEGLRKSPASKEESAICVSGRCLPKGYKKLELPNNKLTHVNMSLEILDVLDVNDKAFSVTINMYFGVSWNEDRLVIKAGAPVEEWLPIDNDFQKNLWMPNVFVYNLVSFKALETLKKLAGMWIKQGKAFFYNQATHVTFMCPMRFNRFPLDEHLCKFTVGSTNYDDTRMTFANELLSFDPTKGNTILDYQVSIGPLKEEDTALVYGAVGNYSLTGFELRLKRNVAKYLYIYYLPSGLFVIVSWTSFLIPPEVVPGRMALLVTLFLVLINIFNTITNVSPNVEGMTAISSWMIACMFFVFGALMAYATLLFVLLRQKRHGNSRRQMALLSQHQETCPLNPSSESAKRKAELKGLERNLRLASVDAKFLVAFPLLFAVFNAFYWPYWIWLKDI